MDNKLQISKSKYRDIKDSPLNTTLSETIYKQYPYPIAYNYLKLNQSRNPRESLLNICNLLRSVIMYFSYILVAQYRRDKIEDINLNLKLQTLIEPSLEELVVYLQEILELYHEKGEKLIINKLHDFYFSKRFDWPSVVNLYNTVINDDFFNFNRKETFKHITPAHLFNVIPDFINTIWKNWENLNNDQIKNLLNIFSPAINEVLESMKFFSAYKLFYVKKAYYQKGKVHHEIIDCMGIDTLKESDYFSENYFAQEKVYISSTIDKDFPVLNLSPFFILRENSEDGRNQFYFFQKVTGDGGLEYENYENVKFASQDYTKDLLKAFRKFTGEKKVNLVIKFLDWQKEKKRLNIDSSDIVIPKITGQEEILSDNIEASDNKLDGVIAYKYAFETAWSDGILTEDEKLYLKELKNILKLTGQEISSIEVPAMLKFAEKIEQAKGTFKNKDDMEQQLEYLEEEHRSLLKILEDRRQHIVRLEKKLEQHGGFVDNNYEKENLDLKKQIEELKNKVAESNEVIKNFDHTQGFEKKFKELEANKILNELEIEKLNEELTVLNQELFKCSNELEDVKKINLVLNEQIIANEIKYSEEEVTVDKNQIEDLLKEKESQNKCLEELNKNNEEAYEKINLISNELETVKSLNTSLIADLDSLKKQYEDLINERMSNYEEIGKLQEELKLSSNQVLETKDKLAALRKYVGSFENEIGSVEENNKINQLKIEELIKEKSELCLQIENLLKEQIDKNLVLEQLNEELKKYMGEYSKVRGELEELKNQNKILLNEADVNVRKLEDFTSGNAQELYLLKEKLNKLENEHNILLNNQISKEKDYEDLIKKYKQEIQIKEDACNKLTEEFRDEENNYRLLKEEIRELNEERDGLFKFIDEMKDKLDIAAKEITNKSEQLRDIQCLDEEKESLIDSQAVKIQELTEKLKEFDKDRSDLEIKFGQGNKELINLKEEKEILIRNNDKQSVKIQELTEKLKEFDKDRSNLEIKFGQENKELINLKEEKDILVRNNDKQSVKIQELTEKLKELDLEKNNLLINVEEINKELKDLRDEKEKFLNIQKELQDEIKELIDNVKSVDKMDNKILSLEKEKNDLLKMNNLLEKKCFEAESKVNKLKKYEQESDKILSKAKDFLSQKEKFVKTIEQQKNDIAEFTKKIDLLTEENEKLTTTLEIVEAEKEDITILNQELNENLIKLKSSNDIPLKLPSSDLEEERKLIAMEREKLESEKRSIEELKKNLQNFDIEAFEIEKKELENAWIELYEDRKRLKLLSEKIDEKRA